MVDQNDNRITRIGALIRRLRIDELPQLLRMLVLELIGQDQRPETILNSAQTPTSIEI